MTTDQRTRQPASDDVTGAEGQQLERKSLRKVQGSTADWNDLAQTCVCFGNGAGGKILVGVEDGETLPPATQRIDEVLLDKIRRRVGELTVNVQVLAEIRRDAAGGEYVVVTVPRSNGVASTSDGRYFVRVGDTCRPVVGDDVLRLANERPATPWEAMTAGMVPRGRADVDKLEQ